MLNGSVEVLESIATGEVVVDTRAAKKTGGASRYLIRFKTKYMSVSIHLASCSRLFRAACPQPFESVDM